MRELVGIDVGGTFTDFVWLVDGRLTVHKEPTTPDDQSRAIAEGLAALGVGPEAAVVHGTTTATNALLERRGARTALLTTDGFADVLAIGRQHRPHLYRLSQHRPPELVPAELRYDVPERLAADGAVLLSLDEAAVRRVARAAAEAGVESVAVVYLFSYRAPAHEQRTAELVRDLLPGVPITLSSDLLPEYREYERTATTVVNAYVRPLVARYLDRLGEALAARRVHVMQSNGGVLNVQQAAEQPARLVLSGPAGGVVGALALARSALETTAPALLTFDMGGTSTDVALCPGALPRTAEHTIADLPVRLPSLDIHTVGAGGGSIARVDAGGGLRVGPESAGARPGPACYGHGGTAPTVTDAHAVLGRLHPEHFLAGTGLTLDLPAARAAFAPLAEALGRSVEAAALGVLRVAGAAMERALRRVSVERGHDPRGYTLVPFGGAGPLHACDLADALGLQQVLVPPAPGVLSALGLLLADVTYDAAQALLHPLDGLIDEPALLRDPLDALTRQVSDALGDGEAPTLAAELDLRYAGQSYELTVPLTLPPDADALRDARDAFHDVHRRRYGHAERTSAVEAVAIRLRATRPGAQPALPEPSPATTDAAEHRQGTRSVWFAEDGPAPTAIYDRGDLRPGHVIRGPAVIHQYDSTTVVPPEWRAEVEAQGALLLRRQS